MSNSTPDDEGSKPCVDDDEIIAELRARPSDATMATFLDTPNPHPPTVPHVDGIRLADVTTFRLGGPCADVVVADTEELLTELVAQADSEQVPLLLIAGGSNVVIADEGWSGRTVLIRTAGTVFDGDAVTVAAGVPWDRFVEQAIVSGRAGIEALSGIPGSVGATPIQNVGAYGQEVAQTIDAVLVWDRRQRTQRWLSAEECGFAYRDSGFKRHPQDFVVLQVRFKLPESTDSAPVRYPELASALGVDVGTRLSTTAVRDAVLSLRRRKGMVLDASDHDSWSAGSFFTNPVLTGQQAARLPDAAPRYPAGQGMVKTSAAWLIEHAGIEKGFTVSPGAQASISTKHTLALTNRGAATTADVLLLARTVQQKVQAQFGITLVPEPVLVGCELPLT